MVGKILRGVSRAASSAREARSHRALSRYAEAATLAGAEFVLRPNDEVGKEFERKLAKVSERIWTTKSFPLLQFEMEAEVRAFADYQRQNVDEVISGMADAIDELINGISASIIRQNDRLAEIERIKECLNRAECASSLEETRNLLSAGMAGLHGLVSYELERQRELRTSYDQYTTRLRAKLDEVERESRTDKLTGIANRAGIERHVRAVLDHCRTNKVSYSFALLDLDGFKFINDRFGHQAGDAALILFSQRLQAAVGAQTFIGRLGGDEFVVVSAVDADMLGLLLHRLNENLDQKPLLHEGRALKLGTSFGIQAISPVVTFEELHKRADAELYNSKRARNQQAA